MSLRQRIRQVKISPQPWKHYKGEIRLLPISSQTLFANKGLNWDVLEIELMEEGWLLHNEKLWDCLADNERMSQSKGFNEIEDFGSDFTDEDWQYYYSL